MDADEFEAWFRLLETPGLGREGARRLLAAFGSAVQVMQASRAARQQVVGPQLALALDTEPDELPVRLRAAQDWLAEPKAASRRRTPSRPSPGVSSRRNQASNSSASTAPAPAQSGLRE